MSELNSMLSTTEPEAPVALRAPAADTAAWWRELAEDGPGRAAARNALITHYAPLVTQVATRVIAKLPDTVELADLVSYGMFGLIDAVEKFEPVRGFKFETYAATRIRGAIIDELRAADWVPRSVRSKARALEQAIRGLEQQLQRKVTDEDAAAHLGWDTAEVRTVRAQVSLSHIAALDGLPTEPDTQPIPTLGSPAFELASARLEAREASALLANAVQAVRDREQQVLRLYYYENLTLAQIGEILGVTESRVSQIHSAAVKKLRESLVRTGAFS